MSLPKQDSPTTQTKFNTPTRGTSLNPNAVEFVPSSLRASPGTTKVVAAQFPASASSSKRALDRSESSISTNSDEEARQYWQQQLPDDITPDFNVVGEYSQHGLGSLSLSGLSLHSGCETNISSALGGGYQMNGALDSCAHKTNGGSFSGKMGFSVYGDDPSSTSYLQKTSKPWEMQHSSEQLFGNGQEGCSFEETTRYGNPNDMVSELESAIVENNNMHPVEFLASQFPGFAADSLAEVYFANGCDLNMTIEMLTQLELQVDGAKNQNMNLKTVSAPNLTPVDFPALPVPEIKSNMQKYIEDELQQTVNSYGSSGKDNSLLFRSNSSLSPKGAIDFASAVRKLSSQDASLWKYDRSGSAGVSVGSTRSLHALSGSYNTGAGRSAYSDRMQGRSSTRAAPIWLETGDAVANLYSEVRGEARDHARIRNVYLEQARQAYLMGNKALAKELSVKGQMHNMQMKAAHSKAQETIYRQRNSLTGEQQGGGRFPEKMIDLHGLHVSEALHVLKQELNVLRNTARLGGQRLHVSICVGTGHHTRGSRTPARLPVAVQGYLLEEGIQFTEPHPGLLHVVIY